MGREKDRELRRRQQRRRKLRKLKAKLAQSQDHRERQRLIEKILRISFFPPEDLPEV